MQYIYKPKGKAGEYGEYALNLFDGCTHGCKYCYVPAIRRKTPENYHAQAVERNIRWDSLAAEILFLRGKSLFLCFTCDPYQPVNDDAGSTRRTISLCHENGVAVTILTKAGACSEKDFDLLAANPHLSRYGATLTFLNLQDSLVWEPGAAQPEERLSALRKAHEMGIPTWASLEPVIDPFQSLEIIRRTSDYVDEFKVGKWNHSTRAAAINWSTFAREAVALLEQFGKKYYIKKDLAVYL